MCSHRLWHRHERNMRSKIWWFTEPCNSHYVSHFAAFFIVTGTKISIVKSCFSFTSFFVERKGISPFSIKKIYTKKFSFQYPQKRIFVCMKKRITPWNKLKLPFSEKKNKVRKEHSPKKMFLFTFWLYVFSFFRKREKSVKKEQKEKPEFPFSTLFEN